MKYRAIIRDAWSLTQNNKRLTWWFAIIPAFLTSLVSIVYIAYQVAAFWSSPYIRAGAQGKDEAFTVIIKTAISLFEKQPGLAVFVAVLLGIIGLTYLMLPVFRQGALIQMIARLHKNQPVKIAEGISYGLRSFLPLFEYHLMVKTFSWVTVVSNAAFILRSLGPESFLVFSWIYLIFLIVGLLITLLFTFSEFYIVLLKKPVFKSIMASSGLVIRQWHHMLFMLLLMAIISARIIINILVALLVPVLIALPILFFASTTLAVLGAIVGGVLGLIALYFTSYFLGVFHVFATSVWTFTFMGLTQKEADDDRQMEISENSDDE